MGTTKVYAEQEIRFAASRKVESSKAIRRKRQEEGVFQSFGKSIAM